MARWTSVPVAGGAYSDDAKPWSIQDTVNRLPVPAERDGTRSPAILRDCPGMSVFASFGTAAVRGLHNAEGLLVAVVGQTLYTVTADGIATSRGTIPGAGRVSIAHNQITGGNEVAIANGLSGYVYNTKTATLSQITDPGFIGAKVFDFVDGYLPFVEPAGRFWGHSNLADATDYNTLDRSEAEAQPDRITTLKVSHREVAVFGERSTEFYQNTGAATGTFQRVNGTELDIGCPSTFGVTKLDNTLYFVGHDGAGYMLQGYQPVRVTTHAIEQAWSRCNLSQAYCYAFEDRGHKIWYTTFTDGQTWGYDVAAREWHRRKSYGLDFWRVAHLVYWNGAWIGGDYANGKLYQLDWALSNDAGDPLERTRTFAVLHDNGNRVHVNAVRLFYDTGRDSHSPPLPQYLVAGVSITGNMGDGNQGDSETGSYTTRAGFLPVTVAVTAGTFPAGLSLASDGSWSGTRTTPGSYSWTVTATDANGNTDTLDDASTTNSGEIFTWRAEAIATTAGCNAVCINDDTIVVAHDTTTLSYSLDRGTTWATIAPHPSGMVPHGVAYYDGAWYCFGQLGGTYRASKSTTSAPTAFVDVPIAFNPFSDGTGNSAWVFGSHLYVSVAKSSGNYELRRFDGTNWTTIDTGIALRNTSALQGVRAWCATASGYLLGTSDGLALRTTDFNTFTTVFTSAASATGIEGLAHLNGVSMLGCSDGAVHTSASDGVTWTAAGSESTAVGYRGFLANGYHFISGAAYRVSTSPDGTNGSWTERLFASALGGGVRGRGFTTRTLSAYGTQSGYVYVGDIA